MGKINMKGGTPSGWASLCATCAWAHIVSGFRESELVVICTEVNPNFPVPFKVQECTNYLDRNRPSYEAMRKLAIYVEPSSSLKPVGFRAKVAVIDEEEGEAVDGKQNSPVA
jgi:hypothetical protein